MDQDELLKRFGLYPVTGDLPVIRKVLREASALEGANQGTADTEVMKLCCVQLFNAAQLDDVLEIWNAKASSMDSDGSIDIQLLCGAGIMKTKEHLAALESPVAAAALERLKQSELAGDLDDFNITEFRSFWDAYYS